MSSNAAEGARPTFGGKSKGAGGTSPGGRPTREFFPLPAPAAPAGPAVSTRSGRKAWGQATRRTKMVQEAVRGLSWIAGYDAWDLAPGSASPGILTPEVLARVEGLVHDWEPMPEALSGRGALRDLLHDRSMYELETGSADLAAFNTDLVSLPGDVSGCPPIESLLDAEVSRYLEADKELMMQPATGTDDIEFDGAHTARRGRVRAPFFFCEALKIFGGIANTSAFTHASPRAREGTDLCDAFGPLKGIANIGALTPRRGRVRAPCFAMPSGPLRASQNSAPSRLAHKQLSPRPRSPRVGFVPSYNITPLPPLARSWLRVA